MQKCIHSLQSVYLAIPKFSGQDGRIFTFCMNCDVIELLPALTWTVRMRCKVSDNLTVDGLKTSLLKRVPRVIGALKLLAGLKGSMTR